MRFAYADPPYYKQGKRIYSAFHPEAHIWDDKRTHIDLVTRLHDEFPDGWALSCNPADLAWLLPEAGNVRVCAWTKTMHQIWWSVSVQYAWEPVLLHAGRKTKNRKPMVRDWLSCSRSNRKGVPGAKPDAFNRWLLDLLGFEPGDELIELFPGTGRLTELVSQLNN